MIYKCKQCDSALEYNPISDKMECGHCGGAYTVYELENGIVNDAPVRDSVEAAILLNESVEETEEGFQTLEERKAILEYMKHAQMMSCKVYTCTSCGADVIINDVEVSTFCSYCGQPTIVFERMQEEMKPNYIIPFRITNEQVTSAIRERIRKTWLRPRDVGEVKPELIRGVYVPHWVFDMHYYDYQSWRCEKKEDDNVIITFHEIEAECDFEGIAVDASENVDDELAQRVGPFDLRCKKTFDPAYLAGYYADMFDRDQSEMSVSAMKVAKPMFDYEIRKRVVKKGNISPAYSMPEYQIKSAEYVLLPVWFYTYRYKGVPHTILVNGQTGKMVGAVPISKAKVIALFVILAILFILLSGALAYFVPYAGTYAALLLGAGIAGFFAVLGLKSVRSNMILSQTRDIVNYAKKRQERE